VIAPQTTPARESVAESLLDFGLRGLLIVPPSSGGEAAPATSENASILKKSATTA
jgi:hypothetical protein